MRLCKLLTALFVAMTMASCILEVDPVPSHSYDYKYSDYYYTYESCHEPYWHEPYYCYDTLASTYCVWHVDYGSYYCDE